MILCVDIEQLKMLISVQKDVDIDKLLREHTKYFDSEEKALEENFAPLNFVVTVRTAYSNKVLQCTEKEKDIKRYYKALGVTDPLPHKGYDLVMYLTSIGIMHCVDYKLGFDEVMMKSQFMPIGVINTFPIANPIIYSQVILEDSTLEGFNSFLKRGDDKFSYEFVDIDDMLIDKDKDPLGEIFASSILKVKEPPKTLD